MRGVGDGIGVNVGVAVGMMGVGLLVGWGVNVAGGTAVNRGVCTAVGVHADVERGAASTGTAVPLPHPPSHKTILSQTNTHFAMTR